MATAEDGICFTISSTEDTQAVVIQHYKLTLPMSGITKIYREDRRRTPMPIYTICSINRKMRRIADPDIRRLRFLEVCDHPYLVRHEIGHLEPAETYWPVHAEASLICPSLGARIVVLEEFIRASSTLAVAISTSASNCVVETCADRSA